MEKIIEFLYKNYPSPLERILRPVAEIGIKYRSNKDRIACIIDSGADNCTFPLGFAIGLQIPKEELEKKPIPTGCACGKTIIHYHVPIEVEIGSYTIPIIASFVPSVKDNEGESKNIPALLGRQGIFDKFDIIFKEKEGKIIFTPK